MTKLFYRAYARKVGGPIEVSANIDTNQWTIGLGVVFRKHRRPCLIPGFELGIHTLCFFVGVNITGDTGRNKLVKGERHEQEKDD